MQAPAPLLANDGVVQQLASRLAQVFAHDDVTVCSSDSCGRAAGPLVYVH